MITLGVEWGPVGTWAGAIATVLVVITTALVALGYFDGFRGPRLRLTFEATEPGAVRARPRGRYGPVGPGRGGEPRRRAGSGLSWPPDQRDDQRRVATGSMRPPRTPGPEGKQARH